MERVSDASVVTEDGSGPTRRNYTFNVAAYELDKLLGLNLVPPTVERSVNGRPASVIWWLDDFAMDELDRRRKRIDPPDQERWDRQVQAMRVSRLVCLFLLPVLLGCRSAPVSAPRTAHYLVTERTVDLGLGLGLCLAVDLEDTAGVWWWERGRSGCGSRSTGPGVFRPTGATVTRSGRNGAYEVGFRLGTHSTERPFIDVRLIIEGDTMRTADAREAVPLVRRSSLDIPEMPPRLEAA